MRFQEGQIYEGGISISGGDGPLRRWLVVAPFGKTHMHSINDPLDLHCWPLAVLEWGIESGRLSYVGQADDHPALEVQRVKEHLGVRDAHMSLSEAALQRLVDGLADAVGKQQDCAPYLAGEILNAIRHSVLNDSRRECLRQDVHTLMAAFNRMDVAAVEGFPAEPLAESRREPTSGQVYL